MLALAVGYSPAPEAANHVIVARARILGAPGSGISGRAVLIQDRRANPVTSVVVTVTVEGLAPNSRHGVHIHENGSCEDTVNPDTGARVPFGGAGGHFDPGPFGQSNPDTNHPFHIGDLPNLKAGSNGKGSFTHRTSRITLSDGPLTIFDNNGSSIIVHLNEDQGIPGPAGSGLSGGPRIACGIIERED
jgi:Cu-Zn family superoxide dismutase